MTRARQRATHPQRRATTGQHPLLPGTFAGTGLCRRCRSGMQTCGPARSSWHSHRSHHACPHGAAISSCLPSWCGNTIVPVLMVWQFHCACPHGVAIPSCLCSPAPPGLCRHMIACHCFRFYFETLSYAALVLSQLSTMQAQHCQCPAAILHLYPPLGPPKQPCCAHPHSSGCGHAQEPFRACAS